MTPPPVSARNAVPELGPEIYAGWRASDIGVITERLERALILKLAGEVRGKKVLDVGCGDGDLALALWQQGALPTGVDLSTEMLATARARAEAKAAEIGFVLAATERLPFGAATFDLVLAVTVLCFIEDAAPVFREMARVLRPGGKLVVGELGKWSSWALARRVRAWCGSALWARARFRSRRELIGLAQQAGLEVETIRGAIYYPRVRVLARLCARWDAALGRLTTFGAAFLALAARKTAAERAGGEWAMR
ncbi:MAG: class I SAM-dependent methyltransferase [Acidobacteriia bacterium]|nr:class I SAM-dependent methyltransferase [Methyloceanibacter sp.]MBX5471027.1 class I SAM-dependent methyltransferase [Acetobacteraceae bacterium]MCL6490950.1 class I SAM-dependent methyltransferase [Terriglobia bacterium]